MGVQDNVHEGIRWFLLSGEVGVTVHGLTSLFLSRPYSGQNYMALVFVGISVLHASCRNHCSSFYYSCGLFILCFWNRVTRFYALNTVWLWLVRIFGRFDDYWQNSENNSVKKLCRNFVNQMWRHSPIWNRISPQNIFVFHIKRPHISQNNTTFPDTKIGFHVSTTFGNELFRIS